MKKPRDIVSDIATGAIAGSVYAGTLHWGNEKHLIASTVLGGLAGAMVNATRPKPGDDPKMGPQFKNGIKPPKK